MAHPGLFWLRRLDFKVASIKNLSGALIRPLLAAFTPSPGFRPLDADADYSGSSDIDCPLLSESHSFWLDAWIFAAYPNISLELPSSANTRLQRGMSILRSQCRQVRICLGVCQDNA